MSVFHAERGDFELRDVVIPDLSPGEVLVRNSYATLCRSDVLTVQGKRREKDPTTLGHEVVGRVEALGPGGVPDDLRGEPVRIGDRITWAVYAADPDTPMSRRGIPQKSEGLFKYGHEQVTDGSLLHGGLASHIILRRHTPLVVLRDARLPDRTAAIINCAVATVAGALRLSGGVEGRRVLVAGAGMLGLVAVAMCRERGAVGVAVLDADARRLDEAAPFGADMFISAASFLRSTGPAEAWADRPCFDLAFDFTGHPEMLRASLDRIDVGGVAVWVGSTYPQPPVQLDAETVVRRLLTVRGLHNYTPADLLEAVRFMERQHRRLPFDALISGDFPLDDVGEAFRHAIVGNPHRVGIIP